ncbi:MAG: hypothetical protein C4539_00775 [Ignavibacteriales bacterium]|nr:MAG: hypothetical protein C4539_00775 [Ignavibacteriales bacterium]
MFFTNFSWLFNPNRFIFHCLNIIAGSNLMKYVKTFLVLLFITKIILGEEMKINVIPVPQIVSMKENYFQLKPDLKILLNNKSADFFTAEILQKTLSETNRINSKIVEDGNGEGNISLIREQLSRKFIDKIPGDKLDESYVLSVSGQGIKLQAQSSKGLFYGVMSLVQLLERTDKNKLREMEIIDWSDLKVRGISDDISRGQVSTIENFKKIIDIISRYKMNVYMPYIEDMLQLESYPSIGKGRGALSKAEVKELVEYASKRFVDVIPIFQTLGHYENILNQKEFLKYAEFPGAACLNVSNDSIYLFLENMLKEVFEMFPSEYFNMGADESHDVGLGYSKHLVDKTSLAKVHLEHYKKVYAIIKKYNKKVLMYGDELLNHPENIKELPADLTVVDWHYRAEEKYPSVKLFKESGLNYYVSPSVWNFPTTFPTNYNAFPNIKYLTKAGIENNATGMINSNWGDYGAETFKELIYMGYAWSAQCAWNIDESNEAEFTDNFLFDFYGVDDARLRLVYDNLNNPINQMIWHAVWRHPQLPDREPAWWEIKASPVTKLSWMESTMPATEKALTELKNVVKKNKDQLDILSFIVKMNEWYCLKMETQFLLRDSISAKQNYQEDLTKKIDGNIAGLKDLKKDFSSIWLKYYKPDNLNLIEDKFDRLINYFEESKIQVASGNLKNPKLTSKWIYNKINDSSYADNAKFRKVITLNETPVKALLQLMGDTYAKLSVNGVFVDEVYTRRSLSLVTEYGRVKLIDITKYLHAGENTITAEVENFNRNGSAGINIISKISFANSDFEIKSDETWQAQTLNESGEWKNAVSKEYPYIVTEPNFITRRQSWIER